VVSYATATNLFSAAASTGLSDTANLVRNNAGNTYSTGAQSFSAATSLTLPVAAGAAPTANGAIAYDSTANDLKYGDNGTTRTVANLLETQTFQNKDISNANNTYRAASDTVTGAVELAIASEVNTGTSTTLAITPNAFADSVFGRIYKTLQVFNSTDTVVTGDQKFVYPIPSSLNGFHLVDVEAAVFGASSSGAVNIDLARCVAVATGDKCSGTVTDILSVNVTIDQSEDDTYTAATGETINTSNNDFSTGDAIRVDVDGAGTSVEGLWVTLIFAIDDI